MYGSCYIGHICPVLAVIILADDDDKTVANTDLFIIYNRMIHTIQIDNTGTHLSCLLVVY